MHGCAESGTPDLSTKCHFHSKHANHRDTDRGKSKKEIDKEAEKMQSL